MARYPELQGKVAIVTGSGRAGGLGEAMARRLAAEGCRVVVSDIGAPRGAEIPADVDVLLVPQLPSMTTPQLEFVQKYIDAGRPALLTVDPLPLFDMSLSPSEPMKPPPGQGQQNMFGPPPG